MFKPKNLVGLNEHTASAAAGSDPKLRRGMVWCKRCGHAQPVDSAECLHIGWPKCCGATMTIDAPEER